MFFLVGLQNNVLYTIWYGQENNPFGEAALYLRTHAHKSLWWNTVCRRHVIPNFPWKIIARVKLMALGFLLLLSLFLKISLLCPLATTWVKELEPFHIPFNCAVFQAKPATCHMLQWVFLTKQLFPHFSYDDTVAASPALVTSRLDYCNIHWMGCQSKLPLGLPNQLVQNTRASWVVMILLYQPPGTSLPGTVQ